MLSHNKQLQVLREFLKKNEKAIDDLLSKELSEIISPNTCDESMKAEKFSDMPGAWVHSDGHGTQFYRSTFHFLNGFLSIEEEMTDRLNRSIKQNGSPAGIEEFIEREHNGYDEPYFVNTHDYDNCLLDVMMAIDIFEKDECTYVIVGIHAGGDSRNGYRHHKVFSCESDMFLARCSEMMFTCKCTDVYYADGNFDGKDGKGIDGLPSFWKQSGMSLHCAQCMQKVDLS